MTMPQPPISCRNIRYRWRGNSSDTLNIRELSIGEGERVFVRGPSGSGKSTLLALLGGIIVAQSGEVIACGQNLSQLRGAQRDRLRADNMGFIFQQFNLLPFLSVTENVMLPCRFSKTRARAAGSDNASIIGEAHRLLQALELDPALYHEKRVGNLSVGQQQRVAAARALIGRPAILIADEPTSSLDADSRLSFINLLTSEAARTNTTIVFVSHDRSLESEFDRVIDLPEINRA